MLAATNIGPNAMIFRISPLFENSAPKAKETISSENINKKDPKTKKQAIDKSQNLATNEVLEKIM